MKSTTDIILELRRKIADLEAMLEETGHHYRCETCEQLRHESEFEGYGDDTCLKCHEAGETRKEA